MATDIAPNPVPLAGPAEYAASLRNLQPRGAIWDGPSDSVMAQLRTAQTALLSQFGLSLASLTEAESYPPTSVLLLPAWEIAFGLPDPCLPLSPTIQQRQQALGARLAARGGLSAPAITAIAAALGYDITITKFQPFRAGISAAGDPCCSEDWAYVWQVNAPQFTIEYFQAGVSSAGDPLASWGNTALQCTLNRICPPETILIFNYG